MSTAIRSLTVDQYDQMVKYGVLPETNRLELINGKIEEKELKSPEHCTAKLLTQQAISQLLPPGWHTRQEGPVRISSRKSEPEPDVSVVRGGIEDYLARHPGPEDVALVVEVTRSSGTKDRRFVRIYGGGGIPAYWIVNLPKRRLEVYERPVAGRYPAPRILKESDLVDLVLDGKVVGQIPVADLLPSRTAPAGTPTTDPNGGAL